MKFFGLEKQTIKNVPVIALKKTGAVVKPECPYCGYLFPEMPKRQRKCPECKQTIYRKSRPGERIKSLVTKEKAIEIDAIWAQHHIDEEIKEIGKTKYNQFRLPLVNEGKNPSHQDVLINMYTWQSENALHRNVFEDFSRSLQKLAFVYYEKQDYMKALLNYLQSAFISGNGIYRNGSFQKYGRSIPPGISTPLLNSLKELELSENDVHNLFVKLNTIIHHQFDTPLHPQDVWHGQLRQLLFKK